MEPTALPTISPIEQIIATQNPIVEPSISAMPSHALTSADPSSEPTMATTTMSPSTAVSVLYAQPTNAPTESPLTENDGLSFEIGEGEDESSSAEMDSAEHTFRVSSPSSYSWFECVIAVMALLVFCAVGVSALCVAVSCVRCCYRCRCVDVDELAEPRMTRVIPMPTDLVYSPLRMANSHLHRIPTIIEADDVDEAQSEAGTPFASPQAKRTPFASPRIRTLAF